MKFKAIEKREEGKFITRYNVTYETEAGNEKVYEIVSRDSNITTFEQLQNADMPNAVVLIMHDEKQEKVLLNREFRMATGRWVYNFPAGLIDPGETAIEAAKRELREETGLEVVKVNDVIGISYSATGFSNETNVCVVGVAEGEIGESNSDVEEIEAGWFTKDEARELLKKEPFAARTQSYVYAWARG